MAPTNRHGHPEAHRGKSGASGPHRKPGLLATAAHALTLGLLFLLTGLATREPSLLLPFYSAHSVLSSPFYAFIATWYLQRTANVAPLLAASLSYGLLLGSTHVVMGIGIVLPSLLAALSYIASPNASDESRSILFGSVFGSTLYPVAIIAGTLFRLRFIEMPYIDIALITLGTALGIMGAVAGSSFSMRTRKDSQSIPDKHVFTHNGT